MALFFNQETYAYKILIAMQELCPFLKRGFKKDSKKQKERVWGQTTYFSSIFSTNVVLKGAKKFSKFG